MVGSRTTIALVSNFEAFVNGRIERAAFAGQELKITRIKPKRATLITTGAADVTTEESNRLKMSLRAQVSVQRIQELLSESNAAVSRKDLTVSAGCHVASLDATGGGSSRPFLTEEQSGDFIPPEFAEMMRRAGVRLNPKIGPNGLPEPIRMVQSASASMGSSYPYFRMQLKIRPESAEVWNNYGSFLVTKRKLDEAIAAFEQALRLDPAFATAKANLAKLLWLHSRDMDKSNSLYTEAVVSTEPSVPSWILSDFAVYCDEGRDDSKRAAELHARATQDDNFPLAIARKALFDFKHGNDFEHANSLLQQALDRQPNNAQILFLGGQAEWLYKGNLEKSRTMLQKACSLDSHDAVAMGLAGHISLLLGDGASAVYYYRRAIKLGQSNREIRANYGLALLMARKPEGALRQLTQVARADPKDLATQTNIAATLYALGRSDQAISQMRQIIDSEPPPNIELEVLAMLHVATKASHRDLPKRVELLVASGTRADGSTIRIMVRDAERAARECGTALAEMIEGRSAGPLTR